jgi:hypothetical protein
MRIATAVKARCLHRFLPIFIAVGVMLVACRAHAASDSALPGDGAHGCTLPRDSAATTTMPERGQTRRRGLAGQIDLAFSFLDAQMDRYHRSTLAYSEVGFGAYYPGGRMGDVDDISVVTLGEHGDLPGGAALRVDYRPQRSGGLGWAGIYFQYPNGDWGQFPGRNLSGATRLTFWACTDHETSVEFFAGGIRDPHPHTDSLPKVSTGTVTVNSVWHRYELDLAGHDLSSVIVGFGLATSRGPDGEPRSIWLDDIAFDRSSLDEPHFLPSNYPEGNCATGALRNSAQVYDQALVLLAFLARRQPDDLRRATLIADALVMAQLNDRTFTDGRLRNAYSGGELIDPHLGTTRLPGVYDLAGHTYLEDESAAGTDTGDMAWAALALVQAHALLPKREGDPYLQAASSIARWIVDNTRAEDRLGGFTGGVQGFERGVSNPEGQQREGYRSTEHNIDLAALFEKLAAAGAPDEGRRWNEQAGHARAFVESMRAGVGEAPIWTGTSVGSEINKSVVPLDAQTWGVLGTRDPRPLAGALDWALGHCTESGRRDAFDYNCNDGDGAWWEGTAQVAAALKWLGRGPDAAPMLARLAAAQVKQGKAAGALPAASRCGLTTGFDRTYRNGKTVPVLYSNWPHIGATAWFIFAALGVNPYFVEQAAAGPR